MTRDEVVRYPEGTHVRLRDGRTGIVRGEPPALGRGMVDIEVDGNGVVRIPWSFVVGYADG